MSITKLPKKPFSRTGKRRRIELPGNPFAGAMEDYLFNLLAGGMFRRVDLREYELPTQLLGLGERTSKGTETSFRQRLMALVAREGGTLRVPKKPGAPLDHNLRLLERALDLDPTDADVLQFAMACQDPALRCLVPSMTCPSTRALVSIVSLATAQPRAMVAPALGPRGRLQSTGLLIVEREGDVEDRLRIDDRLVDLFAREELDLAGLMEQFLPTAGPATLGPDDYPHLDKQVDLATRLLAGALAQRRAGINLLLHGPTGTGKSQLAAALAAALERPLYLAGRADSEGSSPSAQERLTSLRLGNRLVMPGRGLLLFDELEDLFEASSAARVAGKRRDESRMSKQWFNLLLESNPVPTIWISNRVRGIDPAFLRRFSYVIEVGTLTARQRRRVWLKHLGTPPMGAEDLEALVHRFEVSAAHIGSAVAAARLASAGTADRPTLEAVLQPAVRLLGDPAPPALLDLAEYRPEVVNTPIDLEALAHRLRGWAPGGGPGISLCLHGPPGTGKSAYVRYLASAMDRRLIVRRGSDLLSCWVGETERNIADAFEEAGEEDAVLLIDEADSFLTDRRQAARTWELSQTNELLQQLDSFTGLCACTTNLFRTLDQAALRRFTFKIPFQFMRGEQVMALFRHTLRALGSPDDLDGVAGRLRGLANATPGDFAAVSRRLRALKETPSAVSLLAELQTELRVKDTPATRIGFG
jgi:SpoVK/Ycf46/Vps4 family AAA+-type ATPase